MTALVPGSPRPCLSLVVVLGRCNRQGPIKIAIRERYIGSSGPVSEYPQSACWHAEYALKIFLSSSYTILILLSPSPSKMGRQSCWVACLLVYVSGLECGAPISRPAPSSNKDQARLFRYEDIFRAGLYDCRRKCMYVILCIWIWKKVKVKYKNGDTVPPSLTIFVLRHNLCAVHIKFIVMCKACMYCSFIG
jgi:hypothetical protein